MRICLLIGFLCIWSSHLTLDGQSICGNTGWQQITTPDEIDFRQIRQGQRRVYKSTDLAIQFHVIRPSSGQSSFQREYADTIIQVLNNGFRETPFTFYQCKDINYIDNDDILPFSKHEDHTDFFNYYNSDQAINIYLPQSITCIGCGAWAYFPWMDNHAYVIPIKRYDSELHVHEMGHVLGLFHTHSPGELVDRSNCKVAGDLCCDTPAEPELGGHNVDDDCVYFGSEVDKNGLSYDPLVGNYMSYASFCYDFFTEDQIERMSFFVERYLGKHQCKDDYIDASVGDIYSDPVPAMEGQPYTLTVDINNLGNDIGRYLNVKAYYDGEIVGRETIPSLFPNTPYHVRFPYSVKMPAVPGRHKFCIEVESDSLEVLPFNNYKCQEVLVRQRAGIPDLNVSNLRLKAGVAQLEMSNKMLLDLENIGSVETGLINGILIVNELDTVVFTSSGLGVAESRTIELEVPFRSEKINNICATAFPVFAEGTISNNSVCGTYHAVDELKNDMIVDTAYLVSLDSLFIRGKTYYVNFDLINDGPGLAFNKVAFLWVNGQLQDSLNYGPGAWPPGHSRTDSFKLIWYPLADTLEICVSLKAYQDVDLSNNQFCFEFPVFGKTTSTNDAENKTIDLYPNPVSDRLILDGLEPLSQIQFYSADGLLVDEFITAYDGQFKINVKDWPSSVYMLKYTDQGISRFQSFIKL